MVLKTTKTKKTKHGVRVFILQRNECDAPSLLEKYERLLSKRELDSIQIESLHPETKKERLQTRAMVRTVLSSILNEGREGGNHRSAKSSIRLRWSLRSTRRETVFETVDDDDDDEFFCEFERGRGVDELVFDVVDVV